MELGKIFNMLIKQNKIQINTTSKDLVEFMDEEEKNDKLLEKVELSFNYITQDDDLEVSFYTYNNNAENDDNRKLYETFNQTTLTANSNDTCKIILNAQNYHSLLSQLMAYTDKIEQDCLDSKDDMPLFIEFFIETDIDMIDIGTVDLKYIWKDFEKTIVEPKKNKIQLTVLIESLYKNVLYDIYLKRNEEETPFCEIKSILPGTSIYDMTDYFTVGESIYLAQVDMKKDGVYTHKKFAKASFVVTSNNNLTVVVDQQHECVLATNNLRLLNVTIDNSIIKEYSEYIRELNAIETSIKKSAKFILEYPDEIDVKSAVLIKGKLLNLDDTPIDNTKIFLSINEKEYYAMTDNDGKFSIKTKIFEETGTFEGIIWAQPSQNYNRCTEKISIGVNPTKTLRITDLDYPNEVIIDKEFDINLEIEYLGIKAKDLYVFVIDNESIGYNTHLDENGKGTFKITLKTLGIHKMFLMDYPDDFYDDTFEHVNYHFEITCKAQ